MEIFGSLLVGGPWVCLTRWKAHVVLDSQAVVEQLGEVLVELLASARVRPARAHGFVRS